MVDIRINESDLAEVRQMAQTIETGSKDVIRFATNNVLTSVRTAVSRAIRGFVTATATAVNRTLTIKRMLASDMSANITCTGEPLPLISYRVSQVQRGVNVQVLASGSRKLVTHAFIATMRSGHRGVFWRDDRRRGTSRRFPVGRRTTVPTGVRRSPEQVALGYTSFQLPIRELYGPRVPDVLTKDVVMDPILLEASRYLEERLDYHIERLMAQAAA